MNVTVTDANGIPVTQEKTNPDEDEVFKDNTTITNAGTDQFVILKPQSKLEKEVADYLPGTISKGTGEQIINNGEPEPLPKPDPDILTVSADSIPGAELNYDPETGSYEHKAPISGKMENPAADIQDDRDYDEMVRDHYFAQFTKGIDIKRDGDYTNVELNAKKLDENLDALDEAYNSYYEGLSKRGKEILGHYTGQDRDAGIFFKSNARQLEGLAVDFAEKGVGAFFPGLIRIFVPGYESTAEQWAYEKDFNPEEMKVFKWAQKWYETKENIYKLKNRFQWGNEGLGSNATAYAPKGMAMAPETGWDREQEKIREQRKKLYNEGKLTTTVQYGGDVAEAGVEFLEKAARGTVLTGTLLNFVNELADTPGKNVAYSSYELKNALNRMVYEKGLDEPWEDVYQKSQKAMAEHDDSLAGYADVAVTTLGDVLHLFADMETGGFKVGSVAAAETFKALNKAYKVEQTIEKAREAVKIEDLMKIGQFKKRYQAFQKVFSADDKVLTVAGKELPKLNELIGSSSEYVGHLTMASFINQMINANPDMSVNEVVKSLRNMTLMGAFNYTFSKQFMKLAQFSSMTSKLMKATGNEVGFVSAAKLNEIGQTGVALGQYFAIPASTYLGGIADDTNYDTKSFMSDMIMAFALSHKDLKNRIEGKFEYNYLKERAKVYKDNVEFEDFVPARPEIKDTKVYDAEINEKIEDLKKEDKNDGYIYDIVEGSKDGEAGWHVVKKKSFGKAVTDEAREVLDLDPGEKIHARDLLNVFGEKASEMGIDKEYLEKIAEGSEDIEVVLTNMEEPAAIKDNTLYLSNSFSVMFRKDMTLKKAAGIALVHELTHNHVTKRMDTDPKFRKEMEKIYLAYYNRARGYFDAKSYSPRIRTALARFDTVLKNTMFNTKSDGTVDHERNMQEFIALMYEPSNQAASFREFVNYLGGGSDKVLNIIGSKLGIKTGLLKEINGLMLEKRSKVKSDKILKDLEQDDYAVRAAFEKRVKDFNDKNEEEGVSLDEPVPPRETAEEETVPEKEQEEIPETKQPEENETITKPEEEQSVEEDLIVKDEPTAKVGEPIDMFAAQDEPLPKSVQKEVDADKAKEKEDLVTDADIVEEIDKEDELDEDDIQNIMRTFDGLDSVEDMGADEGGPELLFMSKEAFSDKKRAKEIEKAKEEYHPNFAIFDILNDAMAKSLEEFDAKVEAKDFTETVNPETLAGSLGFKNKEDMLKKTEGKTSDELDVMFSETITDPIERLNTIRKVKSLVPVKGISVEILQDGGINAQEATGSRTITGKKRETHRSQYQYLESTIKNELAIMKELGIDPKIIDFLGDLFSFDNLYAIQGMEKGRSAYSKMDDEGMLELDGDVVLSDGYFIVPKTSDQIAFKHNGLKKLMKDEKYQDKLDHIKAELSKYQFRRYIDSDGTWDYDYKTREMIDKFMDNHGELVYNRDSRAEYFKTDEYKKNKEHIDTMLNMIDKKAHKYLRTKGKRGAGIIDPEQPLSDMLAGILYNMHDTGQKTILPKEDEFTLKPAKSASKYSGSIYGRHYNKLTAKEFEQLAQNEKIRDEKGEINEHTLKNSYGLEKDAEGNLAVRTVTFDDEFIENLPEEMQDVANEMRELLGEQASDGAILFLKDGLFETLSKSVGIKNWKSLAGLKPKAVQVGDGNTRIIKAGMWSPEIANRMAHANPIMEKLIKTLKGNGIGMLQFSTASKSGHTRRVKIEPDSYDENVRHVLDNDNKLLYSEREVNGQWQKDEALTQEHRIKFLKTILSGQRIPEERVSLVPLTGQKGIIFENFTHETKASKSAANFDTVIGFNPVSEVFANERKAYDALDNYLDANIEREVRFGTKHYLTIAGLGKKLLESPTRTKDLKLNEDEMDALTDFVGRAVHALDRDDPEGKIAQDVFYRYKMDKDDLILMLKNSLDSTGRFIPGHLAGLLTVENLLAGRFLSDGSTSLLSTLATNSIQNALKARRSVLQSKIAPDFEGFRKANAINFIASTKLQAEYGINKELTPEQKKQFEKYRLEQENKYSEFYDEHGKLDNEKNGVILSQDQYVAYCEQLKRLDPELHHKSHLEIGDEILLTKVPADDMSNGIMAFRLAGISDKNGVTILPSKYVTEMTGGDYDFDGISVWLPDETLPRERFEDIHHGIERQRATIETLKRRSNDFKDMSYQMENGHSVYARQAGVTGKDVVEGPQKNGFYHALIKHETGQDIGVGYTNNMSRGIRQIAMEQITNPPKKRKISDSDIKITGSNFYIRLNTDIDMDREANISLAKQTFVDSYENMPFDGKDVIFNQIIKGAKLLNDKGTVIATIKDEEDLINAVGPKTRKMYEKKGRSKLRDFIEEAIGKRAGVKAKSLARGAGISDLINDIIDIGEPAGPYTTYTKTLNSIRENISPDILKEKHKFAKKENKLEKLRKQYALARDKHNKILKETSAKGDFKGNMDERTKWTNAEIEFKKKAAKLKGEETANAEPFEPTHGLEVASGTVKARVLRSLNMYMGNRGKDIMRNRIKKATGSTDAYDLIMEGKPKEVVNGKTYYHTSHLRTVQQIFADIQYLKPVEKDRGDTPFERVDKAGNVSNIPISHTLINWRDGGAEANVSPSRYKGDYLFAKKGNLFLKSVFGTITHELLNRLPAKKGEIIYKQDPAYRIKDGVLYFKMAEDKEISTPVDEIFNKHGLLNVDWVRPEILQSEFLFNSLRMERQIPQHELDEIKGAAVANASLIISKKIQISTGIPVKAGQLFTLFGLTEPPESKGKNSNNIKGSIFGTRYPAKFMYAKTQDKIQYTKEWDWLEPRNLQEAKDYFSDTTGDNLYRVIDMAKRKGLKPEMPSGDYLFARINQEAKTIGDKAYKAETKRTKIEDASTNDIQDITGKRKVVPDEKVKQALKMSAEALSVADMGGINHKTQEKFHKTLFNFMVRSGDNRLEKLSQRSVIDWTDQDLDYVNRTVIAPYLHKILPGVFAGYTGKFSHAIKEANHMIDQLLGVTQLDDALMQEEFEFGISEGEQERRNRIKRMGVPKLNEIEENYINSRSRAREIAKTSKNIYYLMSVERMLHKLEKMSKSNMRTSFRLFGTRKNRMLMNEFTERPKIVFANDKVADEPEYQNGELVGTTPVYSKDVNFDWEYGVQLPFTVVSESDPLIRATDRIRQMQSKMEVTIDKYNELALQDKSNDYTVKTVNQMTLLNHATTVDETGEHSILEGIEFINNSKSGVANSAKVAYGDKRIDIDSDQDLQALASQIASDWIAKQTTFSSNPQTPEERASQAQARSQWDVTRRNIDKARGIDTRDPEHKYESDATYAEYIKTSLIHYIKQRSAIEDYRNSLLTMQWRIKEMHQNHKVNLVGEYNAIAGMLRKMNDLSPEGIAKLSRGFAMGTDVSDMINMIQDKFIQDAVNLNVSNISKRKGYNETKNNLESKMTTKYGTSLYNHGKQKLKTLIEKAIEYGEIDRNMLDQNGKVAIPQNLINGKLDKDYGKGKKEDKRNLRDYIMYDLDNSPQFKNKTEAQKKAKAKQLMDDLLNAYDTTSDLYSSESPYYTMAHELGIEGYEEPWHRVATQSEWKKANEAEWAINNVIDKAIDARSHSSRVSHIGATNRKLPALDVFVPGQESKLRLNSITLEDIAYAVAKKSKPESLDKDFSYDFENIHNKLLRLTKNINTAIADKATAKYMNDFLDPNPIAHMNAMSQLNRAKGLRVSYDKTIDGLKLKMQAASRLRMSETGHYVPEDTEIGSDVQVELSAAGGSRVISGNMLGMVRVEEAAVSKGKVVQGERPYLVIADLSNGDPNPVYISVNKIKAMHVGHRPGVQGKVIKAIGKKLKPVLERYPHYLADVNRVKIEGDKAINKWSGTTNPELRAVLKDAVAAPSVSKLRLKLAKAVNDGQTLLYYFRLRHIFSGSIAASLSLLADGGLGAAAGIMLHSGSKFAEGISMGIFGNNRFGYLDHGFLNSLAKKSDKTKFKRATRGIADTAEDFFGAGKEINNQLLSKHASELIALKKGASNQEVKTFLRDLMSDAVEQQFPDKKKLGTRHKAKKIVKEYNKLGKEYTIDDEKGEALRNALKHIEFKKVKINKLEQEYDEGGSWKGVEAKENYVWIPKIKGMTDKDSAYVVSLMDALMDMASLKGLIVKNEMKSAQRAITGADRTMLQRWETDYLSEEGGVVARLSDELRTNLLDRSRAFRIGDYERNMMQRSFLGQGLTRFGAFGFEKGQNAFTYAMQRRDFYNTFKSMAGEKYWNRFQKDMNSVGIPIGDYYLSNPGPELAKSVITAASKIGLKYLYMALSQYVGNLLFSSKDTLTEGFTSMGFMLGPLEAAMNIFAGMINLGIFVGTEQDKNNKLVSNAARNVTDAVMPIGGKGLTDLANMTQMVLYKLWQNSSDDYEFSKDRYNRIQNKFENAYTSGLNYLFPGTGEVVKGINQYNKIKE